MLLTIITINYNNAAGLRKTVESVLAQSTHDFEYIVVDGASTDGSVKYLSANSQLSTINFQLISEPDNGIYHAMNKGIRMAQGEYVQFINSGDILATSTVVEVMLHSVKSFYDKPSNREGIDILYGNMLKPFKGRILRDCGFAGRTPTMLDFYTGTLNHSSAYIKRSLFETYGLYDETLRIVSDWKWYVQVIALGGVVPVYVDVDVTVFDMNGISSVNSGLDKAERRNVLEELLPLSVLGDYDQYAFPIEQLKRLNRHRITRKAFWLLERMMFKWEKWFENKERVL